VALRHQVIWFLADRDDVLVLSSSDEMTKKEPKIRSKCFSNVDSIACVKINANSYLSDAGILFIYRLLNTQ
jgi:hypothetical protein